MYVTPPTDASGAGHAEPTVGAGVARTAVRGCSTSTNREFLHVNPLFARPSEEYFLFLRLGFEGYRIVQQASQDVAMYLSKGIAEYGAFTLMSDGSDIPVFAWAAEVRTGSPLTSRTEFGH
nr:hypothetical protein [Cryobacterium adonitolivorans]